MRSADEQQVWERETLRDLLTTGIKERRTARRWRIFFKLLCWIYILTVSYISVSLAFDGEFGSKEPFVAVIEISGPIMSNSSASADNINELIDSAFSDPLSTAVILKINSPGGSVVQSNRIFTELQRFKARYPDKKLYAVIEDVGASGAYWIACAADYIYGDQASIVGSIGVLVESYGFVQAIEKLGVERRIYAAGDNKVFLDPFLTVKTEQKLFLDRQLKTLHSMFIDLVKAQRGERLAKDHAEIFSGEFWLGTQAVSLGIIDGLGDIRYVAQEVVGLEKIVTYATKQSLFSKFTAQTASVLYSLIGSGSGFLSLLT